MKTTLAKPENKAHKKWVLVDAKDQILGRLAVKIANLLRGRDNVLFTPHVDTGVAVIVINASQVKVTGKKAIQKEYMTYSGHMAGEKYRKFSDLINKKPQDIIMHAVKGMLPKNKLSHQMLTHLRVFAGETHSHEAQNPQPVSV